MMTNDQIPLKYFYSDLFPWKLLQIMNYIQIVFLKFCKTVFLGYVKEKISFHVD